MYDNSERPDRCPDTTSVMNIPLRHTSVHVETGVTSRYGPVVSTRKHHLSMVVPSAKSLDLQRGLWTSSGCFPSSDLIRCARVFVFAVIRARDF
jgi:hypothetical protein